VTVVAGSLTYAGGGLPSSFGNAVRLQNVSGQDARFLFAPAAPATGNTYYWSALLRWDGY
jgi:hypothetical protein